MLPVNTTVTITKRQRVYTRLPVGSPCIKMAIYTAALQDHIQLLTLAMSDLPVLILAAICIETHRKTFLQILLNSSET